MRWWMWLGFAAPEVGVVDESCPEPGPDGAELFARTWTQSDPRAPLGDGLGPRFNDRSCAACHLQGGPGGAGPNSKNVQLVLDRGNRTVVKHRSEAPGRLLATTSLRKLRTIFPSLERNTPALFGAGLIDGIPDGDLLVREATGVPGAPWITGRVARDEQGRVARFGWKGQTATLAEFVEAACANELGLQTAAVEQPGEPGPGPDLADEELDALVGFVAALPPPTRRPVPGAADGEALFTQLGCADCHAPSLGGVDGLYSDLMLHDMGPRLRDESGGYMSSVAAPAFENAATADEWRTPPLWGLRDSAPYLHDGRADSLAQAVDGHGGEADPARRAWTRLDAGSKEALEAFLMSLVAPGPG